MKAITIKQPWASLIVRGIKDIENRTWSCSKKYIGQRVLIHASASKRVAWDLSDAQRHSLCRSKSPLYSADVDDLPFGAIIGSVEIVGCVLNHPSIWAEKSLDNKCPGCGAAITKYLSQPEQSCVKCGYICRQGVHYAKPIYNWVLANPILFDKPIQAKGQLSLWDYNEPLPLLRKGREFYS